jgi:hypothetical protein
VRRQPAEGRDAAVSQWLRQVATEPFDLERGLVRVHGLRLAADERVLVFMAHHSVCDGVSQQILMAELESGYRSELTGEIPDASWPQSDRAALAYWRHQLADLPELDLHPDRAGAIRAPFRAGSVSVHIGADLVTAAERVGRSENATVFMVLLAAFQAPGHPPARVPDPAQVVVLGRLPLNVGGGNDMAALPDPAAADAVAGTGAVSPTIGGT